MTTHDFPSHPSLLQHNLPLKLNGSLRHIPGIRCQPTACTRVVHERSQAQKSCIQRTPCSQKCNCRGTYASAGVCLASYRNMPRQLENNQRTRTQNLSQHRMRTGKAQHATQALQEQSRRKTLGAASILQDCSEQTAGVLGGRMVQDVKAVQASESHAGSTVPLHLSGARMQEVRRHDSTRQLKKPERKHTVTALRTANHRTHGLLTRTNNTPPPTKQATIQATIKRTTHLLSCPHSRDHSTKTHSALTTCHPSA
jgi:hypothetical protein